MSFKAKTKYANKYKALFELLFHNMTTACFTIDKQGITLKTTTAQNITIDLFLPADKFDEYVFEGIEPIHVGLGNHVKQFFKTVKNKTVVQFSITKPYVFDIEITSQLDDCIVGLSANIANIQNIAAPDIKEYTVTPISIVNTNFSKMCRSFKSPTFYLTKKDGQLEFGCMMTDIYKKTFKFGKNNPTDISLFHQQYRTDQFVRIIKMASFSSGSVLIYAENDLPLAFESTCEIGTIKIYITSTVE
jgi:hypothetical protein